jgi:serine phosphatase RsbU (regulator of sigma subunit)
VPVKGELLALAVLEGEAVAAPDGRRRRFATTLARQCGLALENALLYQELREQERLRSELEVARRVQRRLLPQAMPRLDGFEADAVCEPAFEVVGDYFDFLDLGQGRTGVVVADVSGKGTQAAFYMAEIKGMVLALTGLHKAPRELLIELNRRLYGNLERRVFASAVYGVLEPASSRFTFARAGHCPPFLRRADGRVSSLVPGGIALGLEPGALFDKHLEEATVVLAPGDALVLYTDGISEAMDEEGGVFGEERLARALAAGPGPGGGAAALRGHALGSVRAFCGQAPARDDLTLIVLRRLPA